MPLGFFYLSFPQSLGGNQDDFKALKTGLIPD